MTNQEIKFRAWYPISQVMAPVGTLTFHTDGTIITDDGMVVQPDNCILMQFTGLKDKWGKEVYDGDIYHNLDNGLVGTFEILNGIGGYYLNCSEIDDKGNEVNNHAFAKHDTTNFEVSANIYEAPTQSEDK